MKWLVRTCLVLLLGLFSYALETKNQQTIGEKIELSALQRISRPRRSQIVDQPANEETEAELNRRVQAIMAGTTLKQRDVQVIKSGTVKVRIQVPSTDFDTMFCLTRISSPIDYLGIAKCQYVAEQFFMYNVDNGTLQSYGAEADGYWVPSLVTPPELQNTLADKLPFILNETMSASDRWQLSVPNTAKITYLRKRANGQICVATTLGASMTVSAKIVSFGWGGCPMLHVLTPQDDEMVGSIVQFRLNQTSSGRRDLVQECVTFDETAVLPQSALFMDICVPGAINQQFKYNIITKHLRTAVNNSGLFFWWRGPIKSLPDLSDSDAGYGWNLPIRRPGSVVAVDRRGYSGVCWSQADGDVIVGQDCGTFAMLPTEDCYLYRVLSRADSYQSVYVTTFIKQFYEHKNELRCLTIRRYGKSLAVAYDTIPLWEFFFDKCQFDETRMDQRFVLASPKDRPCNSTSCQGTLRWAGDLNVMLAPTNPGGYKISGTNYLVGGSLYDDYTFSFPYNRTGRVELSRRTFTGTACIKFDTTFVAYVDSDLTASAINNPVACTQIQVTPVSQIFPDPLDARATVIARYDYRSMLALPNGGIQYNGYDAMRRNLDRTLSADMQDYFNRENDYFVADLGQRGIRRFRTLGAALHPQPSGELSTNLKANKTNGISLPLLYEDIQPHSYISIDLYFRVNRDEIQARGKENSFLLMSFARSSGCVVYVTFTGKPGIQCYRAGNVFASDQVLRFPQNLLDGGFHKVSVLFPPTTSDGFIQLFVDGQLVSHLVRDQWWSMSSTGQSVNFFYDPNFWMYQPLPASLVRASVVGSNNYTLIRQIATRSVIKTVAFQGTPDQIVKVPAFRTVWGNCELIPGTGVLYQGIACDIMARQNGTYLTLPRDVYSLGCSRPGCSINFLPNQTNLAQQYRFMYRPNYPEGFVSENVGDPDLFQDPARLTDGFKTVTVSFGLKYSPVGTGNQLTQDNNNDGTTLLEVGLTDIISYRCVQNCCVSIGDILANEFNSWGSEFF